MEYIPIMFSTQSVTSIIIWTTFKMSPANAFKLDWSQILLFGKKLKQKLELTQLICFMIQFPFPVADLGGVREVRMNLLKFPDFCFCVCVCVCVGGGGGGGRRAWGFECKDVSSNQTGFHNMTDVLFICSKNQ